VVFFSHDFILIQPALSTKENIYGGFGSRQAADDAALEDNLS
jgi:hypothetical protein